jgi:Short-chain alcohol dehydrogenase of unknown specificity
MKKIILITGGSEGLGKATAELLSKENKVIILARSEENLQKVSQEINCEYKVCDVSKHEEVDKIIKEIIKDYKKIDVIINNAGVGIGGDLTDSSFEDISAAIDINVKGTIYMTKAVLPHMYKENSGLIINVGSKLGYEIDEYCSVYCASKWAITGFTKAFQRDINKSNIRVTAIYPGLMDTEIFSKLGVNQSMEKAISPEKVAEGIKFIVDADEKVAITEFGIRDTHNFY